MKPKKTFRCSSIGSLILGFTVAVTGVTAAQGQDRAAARSSQAVPASIEALRLDAPVRVQLAPGADMKITRSLLGASGVQRVIIRLALPAGGEMADESDADRFSRKINIESEQAAFLQRCGGIAPNMRVIARTQLVLNAVFVEVDAAHLPELAEDPAVTRIAPVANYEMDLSETVPYIGASAVQAQGVDGSGIRVAVLDSGIDYNHANLGGSGDPAEYAANDPDIIEPGSFPTDKVVGGFDFTGSLWPNGPEMQDSDPLDDGPAAGHGSHVADIIGGSGGVAPGVDLYAVKVCSSVSTACSGIALIQGMEFAVDPNGDGNPRDHVDIVNMSLGSDYGQPFDDDLSQAVENASAIGVLTVASAGNAADKPYIVGSPSAAPSALSVAQTQVPSAELPFLNVDGVDYSSVFQSWSALPSGIFSAPVLYGAAFGSADGCSVGPGGVDDPNPDSEPYPPGIFSGEIVLVDRGNCNFSIKIFNIQRGGGSAGIIGLVTPGAPFDGALGAGGPFTIPGYMISQADSLAIQAQIGGPGIGTIDPDNTLPLIMQMVGSSSRGPSNHYQQIKPEIGAPGGSVSAEAGTGDGETPFGGTSGAAPMVAGSAALLLSDICGSNNSHKGWWDWWNHKRKKCPKPAITKARLMNTGETNIDIDPFSGLAEITRIGGGEVRVDKALGANAVAWDRKTGQGALSFGFVDVAKDTVTLTRTVRVLGLDDDDSDSGHGWGSWWKHKRKNDRVTYKITPTFRFGDDAANGAVSVSTNKSSITVRENRRRSFKVTMTIDGSLLPGNFMNSGSEGANPKALTANEYDGYLLLEGDNGDEIHLPWHVLPRKSALVKTRKRFASGGSPTTLSLRNKGVGEAQIDGYALIATSPDIPAGPAGALSPTPDIRAVGVNTIPVPAGFCSAEPSFLWLFAINTHERQSHLVPVIHQVALDIDQDSVVDYFVFNFDFSLSGAVSDGRQVTFAQNAVTGDTLAFFFTEHSTNTGNTVLIVCGEQVGLTGTDLLATNVNAEVDTFDFYFGGPGDSVGGLTITPLGERFVPVASDIPGNTTGMVDIFDFGTFPGNTEELGVLLNTNGDRGAGARGGATKKTEALVILAK